VTRPPWVRLAPGLAGREPFWIRWSTLTFIALLAVSVAGCQVERTLVPESTRQLRIVQSRRIIERAATKAVVWAPDGQRIAYAAAGNIWVTDLLGHDRAIAPVQLPQGISWSKPQDLLAVIDGGTVWTMRADGSARRRLNLSGSAVEASWAPGSDRLAVVLLRRTNGDSRSELWLTNVDGGLKRFVVSAPKGFAIRNVQWFSESLYLFYGLSALADPTITEAWRIRIAYPDRQRIPLASPARFLRLAPSGRLIAYLSGPALSAGRGQIIVSRLDGSGRISLVSELRRHEEVAWAPQGDKVAIAGLETQTEGAVWVLDADGSGQARLFSFVADPSESVAILSLQWSPDGRSVSVGTNTGRLTGPIWLTTLMRR